MKIILRGDDDRTFPVHKRKFILRVAGAGTEYLFHFGFVEHFALRADEFGNGEGILLDPLVRRGLGFIDQQDGVLFE